MKKENSLNIRVPDPCIQSWSEMKQEANGRFCGSCSRIVTDFTGYSDEQLIQFFSTKNTDRVCGRFRESQLVGHKRVVGAWWTWVRTLSAILIPFLFSSKSEAQQLDSIPKKMDSVGQETRVQKWRTVMGMPIRNRFTPVDPGKSKKMGEVIKSTDRRKEED